MIKYFVKKIVLSNINKVLNKYSTKVDEVKTTTNKWIVRLESILNSLKSLLTKLEDNELSDEEVEQVKDDIEKVVKEW